MSNLERNANSEQSIWQNNSVLIQLLGLSPVLAISTTVTEGVALGVATFIVLFLSCVSVSLVQSYINYTWRLTWFLVIMASYTTALEILMQWHYFQLYKQLGIYIPLICCNIAILIRMESKSSKVPWKHAALDSARVGAGYILTIVLLAGLREFIAYGSILNNWQLLIPSSLIADNSQISIHDGQLFRFASLQPMALILLGTIVAAKNFADSIIAKRSNTQYEPIVAVQRVRVTGRLKK